jgi:hypothetical protein
MEEDVVKARNLLKSTKQEISKMYGWSANDYSARISETKKGLKLSIKLLTPRKGFKTICDFLTEKVTVEYTHSDVMQKSIFTIIESIILREVEKGVNYGSISGMEWKVYPSEGHRKIQRATMEFMNNLYEHKV